MVTPPPALRHRGAAVLGAVMLLASAAGVFGQSVSAPLTVTTLAGTAGQRQATDATGAAARFYAPSGLIVDGSGSILVADAANNLFRKVTVGGVVTTFAGSPIDLGSRPINIGSADGTGAAASFHIGEFISSGGPWDEPVATTIGSYTLGADSAGNVYFADTLNHTVRKITPAGVVSTIAGSANSSGTDDGTGASARFLAPGGVAVDTAGNVFVTDSGNNTIRKITPAGVVTTFAGTARQTGSTDGTGAAARFSNPAGIAIDSAGNLYVTDSGNHTIRKISSAGVVTTLAGSAMATGTADGSGTQARFNRPRGIAIDAQGNLYVADTRNHAIRKVSASGNVTTIAGSAGTTGSADGTGASARFNEPAGITVDASGNVYIADTGNNTIRRGVVSASSGSLSVTAVPPASMQVLATSNVTLKVVATGTPSPTYQWFKGGVAISGATNANLTLNNVSTATMGMYSVRVTSDQVSFTSTPTNLQVYSSGTALPVLIVTQPTDRTVAVGQSVSFTVEASSSQPLTYQWFKDGVAVTGANAATYTIGSAQTSHAGVYTVTVSNGVDQSSTTGGATLTVTGGAAPTLPSFTSQPLSQSIRLNQSVTFTASATGSPSPTFQWQKNGLALSNSDRVSGATTTSLTITGVTSADAADYRLVATNAAGSAISNAATLTIDTTPPPAGPTAWLVNVSVRTAITAGQDPLIVGFSTNAQKQILVRAAGPAISAFFTALPDPSLQVYSQSTSALVASNDNWNASLSATFAQVGAFPFEVGSKDAALVQQINGAHTAHELVTGTGKVLVEAYDTDPSTGTARLVNVSARTRVGTGDDVLIAGFSITGSGKKRLLIRAVGPTLAAIGLQGTLVDPMLEVYTSGNAVVASNDNWSASLSSTFDEVSAFPLTANSKDAALVVELDAGASYTAQVKGADGGTGVALVEVYELP